MESTNNKSLEEQLAELKQERDAWRAATLYLADCHAATAQEAGMIKSGSKSGKNRLAAIAKTAADIITGPINHTKLRNYTNNKFMAEFVCKRCLSGAEMISEMLLNYKT
jgi:hypothetical protein